MAAGLGDVHHHPSEEILWVRWRCRGGRLESRLAARGVRHRLRVFVHVQPLEAHGWTQEEKA